MLCRVARRKGRLTLHDVLSASGPSSVERILYLFRLKQPNNPALFVTSLLYVPMHRFPFRCRVISIDEIKKGRFNMTLQRAGAWMHLRAERIA